jgi:signal transduction histidine kinase
MDHFQKLVGQVRRYLLLVFVLQYAVLIGGWWLLHAHFGLSNTLAVGMMAALGLVATGLAVYWATNFVLEPTKALWETILHISPGFHGVIPPKIDALHLGRQLVSTLSTQIYQFASQAEHTGDPSAQAGYSAADSLLRSLPLPLVSLDKTRNIVYANEAAAKYVELETKEIIGKNFYSIFSLAFSGEETLDQWLGSVSGTKALADGSWDRVRLKVGETTRQFDLAAHYSRDNPAASEVTLLFFDHTDKYNEDDQGISFVALSVHELRTPLTLLRGYIEVFEDEMQGKLTPELEDFMQKMKATAQQLTAFVATILNVTRVENDQLVLSLEEENWHDVLSSAVDSLRLRAKVRGIELQLEIADDLPSVGVDKVSIYEVINNLIDNAIKYSSGGTHIAIRSAFTKDGVVETTIEDWGVGIPSSVVPHLFNKFYRNFRNQTQIGGTGLGLYLCKAIITAHGGNIWVRTKDGQGTTFGFTLVPYADLADDRKNGDNTGIIRGAHGWIKNHSLYRR